MKMAFACLTVLDSLDPQLDIGGEELHNHLPRAHRHHPVLDVRRQFGG